jgi:rubredoxin
MKKTFVCKSCGHVGAVKNDAKGSILIEIVLWCCFLLPGIIYTLWRDSSRYKKCPVCGSTEIIPLNSPIGREVVEKMKQA